MPQSTEIRNQINEKIIEALSKGLAPWRKPWSALKNTGHPRNATTGKPYRGVNPLLLEIAALDKGISSKWWATYRQWQSLGGQVRRGERGTRIVYWSPITKTRKNAEGEEEKTSFPLMKEYVLFNAEQAEGEAVERQFRVQPTNSTAIVDYEPAEKVIVATGADIRHVAGDQAAYYRPPADYIVLPPKSQFEQGPFGEAGYYGTVFHELMHFSESRLGWLGSYALGELRAEIGSAYLAAEIGMPTAENVENHAKYVDHWIKAMRADSRVIFQIASAASKGVDFLLSFSQQPEEKLVIA